MINQDVLDDLESRQPEILEWLKSFLRIPSVSADPSFEQGMHDARRFLLDRLERMGLQRAAAGRRRRACGSDREWNWRAGKPTLMIYVPLMMFNRPILSNCG